uniref:Uncharacterized protein n=1 Tax=Pithovirus LCDPAC02 TaxID=2506601 RepID=A0A481YR38_9VIRU|nr:MAG: hypothetical protein LCDPAC02_01330 [Pithovirus LCDPAC02]
MREEIVYYGDIKYEAKYSSGKNKDKKCKNGAYYDIGDKYLCGVHSRKELPKRSKDKIERIEIEKWDKFFDTVSLAKKKNRREHTFLKTNMLKNVSFHKI